MSQSSRMRGGADGIHGHIADIRHASNTAQAQMADAAVAGQNEINLAVMSDPQVARIFVVGLYEPDNLSDADADADAEAVQFAFGYPHITVPAGYVHGLSVGLSFFGRAWSEPTLIRLAFAFEQATDQRRAPQFYPTVPA